MNGGIVFVGYKCPLCGNNVVVFSSIDHPDVLPESILSQCRCGYFRRILVTDIQTLDTWRLRNSA